MKKLYRKGTVHPSPCSPCSPSSPSLSLSFLPAAILTLAASLSVDDKQLLAYLLSSFPNKINIHDKTHATSLTCYCFTCYTTYWSRWDSSPNRQLIHQIIDAFEDHLLELNNNNNNNKKKKKQGVNRNKNVNGIHVHSQGSPRVNPGSVEQHQHADNEAGDKQGSLRKIFTFLWDNLWG